MRIFERNNKDVALNAYFVPYNKKKLNIAYVSDHNLTRKNQVVLLMICDNEKEFLENEWHYLPLKITPTIDGHLRPRQSIPRLLEGVGSRHHGDCVCMNCLHSFRTESALTNHEQLCFDHKYCAIVMPYKNKILQYNSGEKILKVPHTIYFGRESLLVSYLSSQNDPNKTYTEKNIYS